MSAPPSSAYGCFYIEPRDTNSLPPTVSKTVEDFIKDILTRETRLQVVMGFIHGYLQDTRTISAAEAGSMYDLVEYLLYFLLSDTNEQYLINTLVTAAVGAIRKKQASGGIKAPAPTVPRMDEDQAVRVIHQRVTNRVALYFSHGKLWLPPMAASGDVAKARAIGVAGASGESTEPREIGIKDTGDSGMEGSHEAGTDDSGHAEAQQHSPSSDESEEE